MKRRKIEKKLPEYDGPRGTEKEELQDVIDLLNEVFRTPSGAEPNMGDYYRFVFNEHNLDNMRIYSDKGKPIAHIGYHMADLSLYGCTVRAGSIGAVCTKEEYRGQKLASRLLEDVIEGIEKQGGDIMIVSGGRGLYKRSGCIENGTGYRFMILKGYTGKIGDEKLSLAECGTAAELAPLHEQESVRYLRSLEEFQVMVDTGAVMNRPGRILTVSDSAGPLAYAAFILPDQEEKIGSIVEYGGSKRALLDAAGKIVEQYDLNALAFDVADWDMEIMYLLNRTGASSETRDIPGTVKILNLPRLTERMKPYIVSRIGSAKADTLSFTQEGDTFVFADGKDEFTAKGVSAVHIIFGKKENDQWNVISDGELKETLKKIFPLPRPWAGLNFV